MYMQNCTRCHDQHSGTQNNGPAGVILDPVYSGKACHILLEEMKQNTQQWKGRKVLFLHTGGLFGMYDKISQLQPMLEKLDKAGRMTVSQ